MFSRKIWRRYWLVSFLLLFSTIIMIKGCHLFRKDDSPTGPVRGNRHGLSLKLGENLELAKATGITIEGVALDDAGNATDITAGPVNISNVTLPQDVPLTVYVPPCRWRITVTVSLSREPPRSTSTTFDACQTSVVLIQVDTFEDLEIEPGANPIRSPDTVQRGEALTMYCGPVQLSAPDSDRAPVSAILSEQDGGNVNGPVGPNASIYSSFPDPYPLTSPQTERIFTCRISDGRAKTYIFTKTIQRLASAPTPTVTPIFTPTSTLTPQPTATPEPTTTPNPTATPEPTATPTPTATPDLSCSGDLCVNQNHPNANDGNFLYYS